MLYGIILSSYNLFYYYMFVKMSISYDKTQAVVWPHIWPYSPLMIIEHEKMILFEILKDQLYILTVYFRYF